MFQNFHFDLFPASLPELAELSYVICIYFKFIQIFFFFFTRSLTWYFLNGNKVMHVMFDFTFRPYG